MTGTWPWLSDGKFGEVAQSSLRAGRDSQNAAGEDIGPEEGRGCSKVTQLSSRQKTQDRSPFPMLPECPRPHQQGLPGGNK